MQWITRVAALLVLALGSTTLSACGAAQRPYAPLDQAGPKLSVSASTVAAATQCYGDPHSAPEPVLLSPATSLTPEENFSLTWERAFVAQGRYWCALTMPDHTSGDIQVAGEYLVSAIRTMHAATGRRIAIMGHSQGGMSMRWALRWWPDTRTMVDDVIGLAGPNHGAVLATCRKGSLTCGPAIWQQLAGSDFLKALNSRAETFAGISYTEIYSSKDEVLKPPSSAALHTGQGTIANIEIQEICPGDEAEHVLVGTVDATAYALAMDALTYPGPADPARIDRAVCQQAAMPYAQAQDVQLYRQTAQSIQAAIAAPAVVGTSSEGLVAGEPRLASYVWAK